MGTVWLKWVHQTKESLFTANINMYLIWQSDRDRDREVEEGNENMTAAGTSDFRDFDLSDFNTQDCVFWDYDQNQCKAD